MTHFSNLSASLVDFFALLWGILEEEWVGMSSWEEEEEGRVLSLSFSCSLGSLSPNSPTSWVQSLVIQLQLKQRRYEEKNTILVRNNFHPASSSFFPSFYLSSPSTPSNPSCKSKSRRNPFNRLSIQQFQLQPRKWIRMALNNHPLWIQLQP